MTNRLPSSENNAVSPGDSTAPVAAVPFVLLPIPAIAGAPAVSLQQHLYQIALQQATQQQAEQQRPARYESDWLNSEN